MTISTTVGALFASALAATCAAQADPVPIVPETLFTGGRIYLGAPDWRPVDALVAREGIVVDVGRSDDLARRHPHAERVDLRGKFALPGFHDAHGHLEGLGASLESVDLRGAASYAEVVQRTAERARQTPQGEWVIGRGWDQNLWPEKEFPVQGPLSAAVPDHPVFLERVDGHAALVNARALELAGLSGDLRRRSPPDGGQILLDVEGRATGVLVDNAVALVDAVIPPPTPAVRERRLLAAQAELLRRGITAVDDMGVGRETLEALTALDHSGEWKLRVFAYLWGNAGLAVEMLDWLGPDCDRVRIAGVKLMADGALGSRGAALLEEYSDAPQQFGLVTIDSKELSERITFCSKQRLQPAIHAIGDRANREVLDQLERAERRDPKFRELRPRIEHAQVVARGDLPRFAELGVIPSVQPQHLISDMFWAVERLGPYRLEGAYAWMSLDGPQTPLAFGSDFPVEPPDVTEGLRAAVTRRDRSGARPDGFPGDGELSLREALAAYTLGAAWAVHEEERLGRLAVGYAADLVVLDRDPFRLAPSELPSLRVLMTVIAGEVVWRLGRR